MPDLPTLPLWALASPGGYEPGRDHESPGAFPASGILGRVDEVIVFNKLTFENFQRIARLMVDELVPGMQDKGITLTYDDSVPVYLAKIAYGSKKNARGLRDAVRRQVEDQLASALVFHQDQDIHAIALTAGDDGVQLQINP